MSEYVLDKVRRLLSNGVLSDSDIALACGVSWQAVQSIKRQMKAENKKANVG